MQIIMMQDGEIKFILADNATVQADSEGKLQMIDSDHTTTVNDIQLTDATVVSNLDDALFHYSVIPYEYLPYTSGQIILTDMAKAKYGVGP